jgi:catecholate siderophore receptor
VYPGSAVSAAGTLTLSAYNNANRRTNLFNQTDLTKKFSAGAFEHTVLAGSRAAANQHQQAQHRLFGAATGMTVPASNPFATATHFAPNGPMPTIK